jgi:hypothetical protein
MRCESFDGREVLLTSDCKDVGAVLAPKVLVKDGRVSGGSRTRPAHPGTCVSDMEGITCPSSNHSV